jgi:hypothetical protein
MCIRRAKGKHENACFYVGECLVFQKKLVMGQSNGSFWKKEKHKRKTTVSPTLH